MRELRSETTQENIYKNLVDAVRLNNRLKKNKFLKNVRNDFYQFNKLTQELNTIIRHLNQTMTNTFKWKLRFFEELAKSKSNIDTLILETNLLQNTIKNLPKNLDRFSNTAQKNQTTKQMLDEIEKWAIKIRRTFNDTLTSWRTLANNADDLKQKWKIIAENSEGFRFKGF
ncbi:hypothetical protein RFI_12306, partial [Reticulomyxa filosa]